MDKKDHHLAKPEWVVILILVLLAGCGGGADTPTGGTVIGATGGTVTGPGGATVVIPAGALAADTTIKIEQSADGAPVLPKGFTAAGPVFAFTPHGTTFASPATLTVPFDPTLVPAGATVALYKTNAQQAAWEGVAGAPVNGATISGQISGFSFVTALALPLASSDPFPPHRIWEFVGHDASDQEFSLDRGEVFGGVLSEQIEFGSLIIAPSGNDNIARGQVFANESGMTYGVAAEAPRGEVVNPLDRVGGETRLLQRQFFRKHANDATLRFKVTQVWLDAIDNNGAAPVFAECPWAAGTGPADVCLDEVLGEIDLSIAVVRETSQLHAAHQGTVRLWGWQENWKWEVQSSPVLRRRGSIPDCGLVGCTEIQTVRATPIFHEGQLDYLVEDGAAPATNAKVRLREPFVIAIDLSAIPACVPTTDAERPCVGGEFFIETTATALAHNRRGRESFVGTYLRDPATSSGLNWETSGLKTIAPFTLAGPIIEPDPQCNGSTTSAAGELQFSVPTYALPEYKHTSRAVLVTRTGGTQGQVIARVQTSDGTAIAGTHYQPVMQTIVFGDGDDVPRAIEIPIVNDTVFSGPTTISLTLSAVGACANIGNNANAVITILDDETPLPTTFTVGGTVSGLVGSGLVLEEVKSGPQLTPGNGPFVFDRAYNNGADYEVRIATQPTNPTQICSLANPSGMIANASVTNLAVTCTTPAANGALDPNFGEGGKVTSSLVASSIGNPARAVALQSDGKIVVLANMALVRFNSNGSVDESFGTAGVVPVVFQGTSNNETSDLAIDANNRIIVVGWTRASNTTLNYDFAINRYDANGTLDTSFDGDGKLTIDFFGEVDRAHRVLLDSDGRILITGQANARLPEPNPLNTSNTVFILSRLNSDGSRDNSLLARIAFDGGYSVARALALAPTGKIMLGGSTAADGVSDSNTALARFGVDGTLDSDQDSDSAVWFGALRKGVGADDIVHGGYDYVTDLVITGDDRIWGAVFNANLDMTNAHTGRTGKLNFLLAEFGHGFGDDGQAPDVPRFTEVPLGPGDDLATALARQADGKLVLVGSATNTDIRNNDFGIVRFDANGALDTAFGSNGVLKIDFFGGTDTAKDIVVQPDGKLIVIGAVRNGSTWNLGLARVNP